MIGNILAQTSVGRSEYLNSLQNRFSQTEPEVGSKLFAIVAVFVAAILCFVLINRIQKRKVDPNIERPFRLFAKAMKCLKLSWSERWRLWRLAKSLKLQHPTALFISPGYYDMAIDEYARRSGLFGGGNAARRWATDLRRRIFTDPSDHTGASASSPDAGGGLK